MAERLADYDVETIGFDRERSDAVQRSLWVDQVASVEA